MPSLLPKNFNVYIEPFFGGGAAFFALQPKKALISDANIELMEMYSAVRDNWKLVVRYLREHARNHCDEYYYTVRAKRYQSPYSRAARFLYLNRTCWNGLYRVNFAGEFNVPRGTKQKVFLPTDDFERVSLSLSGIEIRSCDFEVSVNEAGSGDLLFIDPPYTVRHNLNGFVKYNQKLFSWEDQIRLKKACERALDRGAQIYITNANHASIKDLYSGFGCHHEVGRPSVLSGSAKHRGPTSELLIVAGK